MENNTDNTANNKKTGKGKAKARNISVYDDFWNELTDFVNENPGEGNRSSLITRVVLDYIIRRKAELKKLKS